MVYRGQQVVCLLMVTLLLPEVAEAYRRSNLQRFRLLSSGCVKASVEVGFGAGWIGDSLLESQ